MGFAGKLFGGEWETAGVTPRLNPFQGAPDGAIQQGKEAGGQRSEVGGHPGEIRYAVTASISQGREVRGQQGRGQIS